MLVRLLLLAAVVASCQGEMEVGLVESDVVSALQGSCASWMCC